MLPVIILYWYHWLGISGYRRVYQGIAWVSRGYLWLRFSGYRVGIAWVLVGCTHASNMGCTHSHLGILDDECHTALIGPSPRSDALQSSMTALGGRLDTLADHIAQSLAATSQSHGALEREAAALRATCDAGTSELERRQQVSDPSAVCVSVCPFFLIMALQSARAYPAWSCVWEVYVLRCIFVELLWRALLSACSLCVPGLSLGLAIHVHTVITWTPPVIRG